MARDIVFDVLTEAKGRGLLQGANELEGLASSAERAERNLGGMSKQSGQVDSEIKRLRQSVVDIGKEIDRTGNADLFKNLRRDKSQLRQFENLAKELEQAGKRGGNAFTRGFSSAMSSAGSGISTIAEGIMPIVVGMVIGALPAIGGAVAGAVAGVTGIGGIAGGILMAAKDNTVRSSARAFGAEISKEFFGSGDAFVMPIVEGLDILRNDFKDLDLASSFEPLAKLVPVLAEGLGGFAKELMPGLRNAFEGMGPVIQALAEELPDFGRELGNFFDLMTNSQGTVTGLRTLFMMLDGTVEMLGQTIAFLANQWDGLVRKGAAVTGWLEDMPRVLVPLAPLFGDLNNGLEEMAGIAPEVVGALAPIPGRFQQTTNAVDNAITANSHLVMSVEELGRALDKLFGDQMNYDQAVLAVQKDTIALRAAVASGTATLNTHTQAGVTNRGMILDLIRDYERQRQASIAAGKGTAEATRKFDDQVAALGRMLTKLGFNKTEIEKLLGAYKKLHDAPDIHKEIVFHVKVGGQTGALSLLGNQGKIPSFDVGGFVDAPRGQPQLAIVHGGEYISTTDEVDKARGRGSRALGSAMSAGSSEDYLTLRVVHETPDGRVIREELLKLKRQQGGRSLGFED